MTLKYPLINVDDIEPSDTQLGNNIRVAISQNQDCTSLAYHFYLEPGDRSRYLKHLGCPQIFVCIAGEGSIKIEDKTSPLQTGHCIHIPAGISHQLINTSDENIEIVGFYLGKNRISEIGISVIEQKHRTEPDLPYIVHWDDVIPENMNKDEGWHINDFRLPFGNHNGSASTLFSAQFYPGAVHKKHSHSECEEIYYLISGYGLAGAGADRVEVKAGHFHYIPAGVEHWLYNLSKTEPIHVIGVYIGSGSVPDTGYLYHGEVTLEDVASETI